MNTHCRAQTPEFFPRRLPAGIHMEESENWGRGAQTHDLCLEHAPIRILVVNDDLRSAGTLKHTLADLGYSETLVAYSGRRALAAVASYAPAVAIVDLEIEDMTGYRLAGMLKGHALRAVRDVPLIAVSNYAAAATAELALAAGFVALLTKPVRPWQLRKLLQGSQL